MLKKIYLNKFNYFIYLILLELCNTNANIISHKNAVLLLGKKKLKYKKLKIYNFMINFFDLIFFFE